MLSWMVTVCLVPYSSKSNTVGRSSFSSLLLRISSNFIESEVFLSLWFGLVGFERITSLFVFDTNLLLILIPSEERGV